MRLAVFAIIAHIVTAQGPANGLAKSTYGTSSRSAIPGLNFLLRLFPVTVAEDNPTANMQQCPKGSSEQTEAWWFSMGRAQLVMSSEVGTCEIKYGPLRSKTNKGVTSVIPSFVKGHDCTYRSDKLVHAIGGSAYVAYAHNPDTCCKACVADPKCTGAVYRSSGKYGRPEHGEGFGLHMPALPGHSTSGGGLSVETIEEIFHSKLASMEDFDWFMDYNVGLFTSNLDAYLNKMDDAGIKYLAASWPTEHDGVWYSVFVHVPYTQMVIELLGAQSTLIRPTVILEQRMTDARIMQVKDSPPTGMLLTAVSVSRAISDINPIHVFYVEGVQATVTTKIIRPDVIRHCYQWDGAMADVCFTQRSESATYGTFKPKQFEDMLHANHAKYLTNPNCGMDRWEDNHYAVDSVRSSNVSVSSLMNYVKQRASTADPIYYKCGGNGMPPPPPPPPSNGTRPPHPRPHRGGGGAHYVFDPSGWGIQLDIAQSVVLPGCNVSSLSAPFRPDPNCGGGTCDAQLLVELV